MVTETEELLQRNLQRHPQLGVDNPLRNRKRKNQRRRRKLHGVHDADHPNVVLPVAELQLQNLKKTRRRRRSRSHLDDPGDVRRSGTEMVAATVGARRKRKNLPKRRRRRIPAHGELRVVGDLNVARDALVATDARKRNPRRSPSWRTSAVGTGTECDARARKFQKCAKRLASAGMTPSGVSSCTCITYTAIRKCPSSENSNLRPLTVRTSVDWSLVTS